MPTFAVKPPESIACLPGYPLSMIRLPNVPNLSYFEAPEASSTNMTARIPGCDTQDTLRNLIQSVAPEYTSAYLEAVPSVRPQVRIFATTPDADALMLSLSPPASRVLRSERYTVLSEALLLQWLASRAHIKLASYALEADSRRFNAPGERRDGAHRQLPCPKDNVLQPYLPRLLDLGSTIPDGQSGEYILTRPVPGILLSALRRPLGKEMRRQIDFQIGQLLRRISAQQSPDGSFGTAVALLSPGSASTADNRRLYAKSHLHTRYACWYDAFLSILEATLRDAEDFKVVIRYEAVRDHVKRFKSFMCAVQRSCLVAVDAGEDTNTLVSAPSSASITGHDIASNGSEKSRYQASYTYTTDGLNSKGSALDSSDFSYSSTNPEGEVMEVTGIQEWSNCIFGDPLFASVLSRKASLEIWKGFNSSLSAHDPDMLGMSLTPIDDLRNAHIRCLLYECYHAITDIVREYCRRRGDSDAREMPARKRLTEALKQLDSLDDFGRERRSNPVEESSPAKRVKISCEKPMIGSISKAAGLQH
ncbi:hypothetical protein HIM_08183 [Hirsutella minnesotensis 3608]|uniref:Aminoglycoside phosphotransferase domain-containing protein n=1 Tax=Hirsutella minnesotensis 3608 TaxID=1043627 RepID=A0A0F7ZMP9_9HYPO|nr:hypothetical protein HIM_08183 [Hirsutella minnesotensis 3608]